MQYRGPSEIENKPSPMTAQPHSQDRVSRLHLRVRKQDEAQQSPWMEETGQSTGRPRWLELRGRVLEGRDWQKERNLHLCSGLQSSANHHTLVTRRNTLGDHTVVVIVHVTLNRVENLIIHRTSSKVVRRNGLSSGVKFAFDQMLLWPYLTKLKSKAHK